VSRQRLRVRGRFVTKEQAFEMLGLSQDELINNNKLQEMLTAYAE
jgi:hypothetical protein